MIDIETNERKFTMQTINRIKDNNLELNKLINRDAKEIAEKIRSYKLTFFDEALAIDKLIKFYGLTQEDAASELGRAQSTIANKLRLLRLSKEEQEIILKNNLTERHARALLKIASESDRKMILDKIIKENMNVDSTELCINNFLGRTNVTKSYKKRKKTFHSVGSLLHTINSALEAMKISNIGGKSEKIVREDFVEYRIIIPMHK